MWDMYPSELQIKFIAVFIHKSENQVVLLLEIRCYLTAVKRNFAEKTQELHKNPPKTQIQIVFHVITSNSWNTQG